MTHTVYKFDDRGYYLGTLEVDQPGYMPPQTTDVAPPNDGMTHHIWSVFSGTWTGTNAAPPTPAPIAGQAAVPRVLTRLEFIRHLQDKAGTSAYTDARNDPALVSLWDIVNNATVFEHDDQTLVAGLNAAKQLGHITQEQLDAIINNWPVQ